MIQQIQIKENILENCDSKNQALKITIRQTDCLKLLREMVYIKNNSTQGHMRSTPDGVDRVWSAFLIKNINPQRLFLVIYQFSAPEQ